MGLQVFISLLYIDVVHGSLVAIYISYQNGVD